MDCDEQPNEIAALSSYMHATPFDLWIWPHKRHTIGSIAQTTISSSRAETRTSTSGRDPEVTRFLLDLELEASYTLIAIGDDTT